MNYLFLFFIFATAVLIIGGTFSLFSGGKTVLGSIYFLSTLIAAIVFGLRWFQPSGDLNKPTVSSWPPVINTCPDFLTLYNVGGTSYCIDTIGIVKPGGITQWTDPTQTDTKYLFNLFLDLTGTARAKALCEECNTKLVTWEGVFDGATCMNVDPPKPTGAA
jgi:hypothetical protein